MLVSKVFLGIIASSLATIVLASSNEQSSENITADPEFLTHFFLDKTVGMDHFGPDHYDKARQEVITFTRETWSFIGVLYHKRCMELCPDFTGRIGDVCPVDMEPAFDESSFFFPLPDDQLVNFMYLPPGKVRSIMFESLFEMRGNYI